MIKAVKIHETFDDFLEEHPELTPVRDSNGNVTQILFPISATKTSFTNVLGNIKVFYSYKGNDIRFPEI